jgi:hypothetical protein
MIDDNGKKVSAIFKDKKNANKFNRNKPADIKKLLQLAKKTKYPKAIDESVNEGSLDWEKNFKWANEKELKVIAKVVHMSNGIAPVIKMSKKKDFKPFIKKAAQKGLGESVNERKNPKRERAKKDFLKSIKNLEKNVRRIKQFARANEWGAISSFVEDDLVYDMTALKNDIDTIISLPVEESVNESYKKIGKKVIKYKDKTGSWNWDIESGIDTDVLDGKTPKIMINYQHKDEKGFPKSGGNFFWLKEKDGTPYTPQKAKAFLNKISNKNTIKKFLDSIKPSGTGNLVVYKGGKFVRESVNEAVEPTGNIKKVLDVAKNKQAKKIGGTLVDLTTAGMMTQVWDKVNDSSKEKMNKMNTKQLINLILKLWDRMGTPRV